MPRIKLSDNDIEKTLNTIDLDKYEIFREYEKNNNKFLATNNFFISEHFDDNSNDEKYIKILGNNNEKYIEKYEDTYFVYYNVDYNDKEVIKEIKEINLMVIKNLNIEINNYDIDIKKLIKNNEISNLECDKLIEDFYFSPYYINKFNISNTSKLNLNKKKYIFKIKRGEINIKNQIEQCHFVI